MKQHIYMKTMIRRGNLLALLFSLGVLTPVSAQHLPRYTGTTLSDPTAHDGRLSPVVGVHNIQIMRANREHPSAANGNGWTYNHQPMMAYWHGRFYVHYLSDEKDEQVPPSHTNLQTSADGYTWTNPVVLFPEYHVPEGFKKEGVPGEAHNLIAVMHQRQGFYVSKDDHLYALGTYGVCLNKKDHNNDGNGIGRVIREIKADGTFGPIYFIYYNHGFNEHNTDYPNWRKGNKHLRKACTEILSNPRMLMGWVEEADRGDTLIPLNKEYKAYNDYTLPNGNIIAFWKHALTSVSTDGGRTWLQPVNRAKGFVNSNAKIWGQRLTDGTYATVYNPSEFRWPLAISLSADGLNYTTLNLVNGEVPPMRYGGNYKSYGPQYVRGILEGNGVPKDSDLWVAYSMNKEDMWVAHIPVPVQTEAHGQAHDDFALCHNLHDLNLWNIYSPLMAPVRLNGQWLELRDADPFDYARVERKIPATAELNVSFDLKAGQNNHGTLQIEFLDAQGSAASRIDLLPTGIMQAKGGARYGKLLSYQPDVTYHVSVQLSVANRTATFFIDGKKVGERMFFAPVHSFERIAFRTGERRSFPTVDTPADWDGILPHAGDSDSTATFAIAHFTTASADEDGHAAFLKADDYKHYVDYFNNMEDENIVQAIPNAEAADWMKRNVPLFSCPSEDFERMYYYRWWTLRKHIERTSVGYAMTEFLIRRSYADKYNLISSALGHHIHEARWLRDPQYLDQIIHTWFHGNNGAPMRKLDAYSSWTPASIWDRYLVDGRSDSVKAMLPLLQNEYGYWERTHRWTEGGQQTLYWQYDVKDAMEETISGGRREKNARPSINSYMYGNARALSHIAQLAGQAELSKAYAAKADTLARLVETRLWNPKHRFFEVLKPDSFANVREEIGFIPWYFNLPADKAEYASAWLQAADESGFSAPYGLTTAERRHPLFRTHGVGKCEWDGAVWPFATSQTLTGLINFIHNYKVKEPLSASSRLSVSQQYDSLFFSQMQKYVESQSHRGRPYIGEYLDETTGCWLKGDQERSRYYNHSTFNDLIITGICGLEPRADNRLVVSPVLPSGKWRWFCLDNVRYHGHDITVVWDEDGSRYHAGRGLMLFVDGEMKARRSNLGRLETTL